MLMSKGKYLIIHYGEIGLKGQNRGFFESKLMKNLRTALNGDAVVRRKYGKIVVELKPKSDLAQCKKILGQLPGIASSAFAEKAELTFSSLQKTALELLSKKNFTTFGIVTRRSNKAFPKTSQEINVLLGNVIREKLNKKVDLSNPDINLYVEISEKEIYVYTKKYPGIGGLPVGSSGKAVALLSGGIDSPVASFMSMKRGMKVVFVHVLNKTMTGGREGAAKIGKIVSQLAKIQGKSKLYIVPFEEIQKTIITQIPAEYRMIIYRRFMLRIAEVIAVKEKAKGIITGDSVGQVASQTLDNLKCVYDVASLPILPPLIGMNKEEIITIAKQIGTYELSILPYPDCCSFMLAKHPETRANIEKIEKLERLIPHLNELVKENVKKAQSV
jgi:tRNA uracil 4-sulfurtransferase